MERLEKKLIKTGIVGTIVGLSLIGVGFNKARKEPRHYLQEIRRVQGINNEINYKQFSFIDISNSNDLLTREYQNLARERDSLTSLNGFYEAQKESKSLSHLDTPYLLLSAGLALSFISFWAIFAGCIDYLRRKESGGMN